MFIYISFRTFLILAYHSYTEQKYFFVLSRFVCGCVASQRFRSKFSVSVGGGRVNWTHVCVSQSNLACLCVNNYRTPFFSFSSSSYCDKRAHITRQNIHTEYSVEKKTKFSLSLTFSLFYKLVTIHVSSTNE